MNKSTTRLLPALALAAAAAVALAACGSSDDTSMPMNDMHGMHDSPSTSASESIDHNDQDIMFAQMMIPHHRQALEMAGLALERASSPEVVALAEQIQAAQDPEIQIMTAWLTVWGVNLSDAMSGMPGHSMQGMMSDATMTDLGDAEGAEFDRLFLEGMIVHHEGAVTMAEQEIASGKSSDAIDLAHAIVTAQTEEIAAMKALLG